MKFLILFLFPVFAMAESFSCEDSGSGHYYGSVDGDRGSFSKPWEYLHFDMIVTVGAYMGDRLGLHKKLKDGTVFYFQADYYFAAETKSEFDASIFVYHDGPVQPIALKCKLHEARP